MALTRINHGVGLTPAWRWPYGGPAPCLLQGNLIPGGCPGRTNGRTVGQIVGDAGVMGRKGQVYCVKLRLLVPQPRPLAGIWLPWGPKRYSPNATVRRSGTRPRSRRPAKPPQSLPHYVHLNTNHQLLTNLTIVRSINGYGSPCAVVQRSRRRRSAMPRRSSSKSLSAHE